MGLYIYVYRRLEPLTCFLGVFIACGSVKYDRLCFFAHNFVMSMTIFVNLVIGLQFYYVGPSYISVFSLLFWNLEIFLCIMKSHS